MIWPLHGHERWLSETKVLQRANIQTTNGGNHAPGRCFSCNTLSKKPFKIYHWINTSAKWFTHKALVKTHFWWTKILVNTLTSPKINNWFPLPFLHRFNEILQPVRGCLCFGCCLYLNVGRISTKWLLKFGGTLQAKNSFTHASIDPSTHPPTYPPIHQSIHLCTCTCPKRHQISFERF